MTMVLYFIQQSTFCDNRFSHQILYKKLTRFQVFRSYGMFLIFDTYCRLKDYDYDTEIRIKFWSWSSFATTAAGLYPLSIHAFRYTIVMVSQSICLDLVLNLYYRFHNGFNYKPLVGRAQPYVENVTFSCWIAGCFLNVFNASDILKFHQFVYIVHVKKNQINSNQPENFSIYK